MKRFSSPLSTLGTGAAALVISVGLGAIGTHSLADLLDPSRLRAFQTANHYLSLHGLALLALSAWMTREPGWNSLRRSADLLLLGCVLFSGSLYAWTFTGLKFFVYITPLGGLSMLFGWASLGIAAFRKNRVTP